MEDDTDNAADEREDGHGEATCDTADDGDEDGDERADCGAV